MIDELEMRLLHEADHPACNRDIWPEDLLREAAADIVVKKAAIAESARMIHKLMTRALAAEAERDTLRARLKEAEMVIEPFAAQFALIECTSFHGIDDNGTWPVDEDQVVQISHLRAARSFLNSASNKEGAARAQQESSDADQ